MTNMKQDQLCAAISLTLLLCAGSVSANDAQSTGEDSGKTKVTQLESIEVTARGIKEPLQRAPLPITVISEQVIEEKGLVDIRDVANLTPGFSVSPSFGRTNEVPVIRGMSNITQATTAETSYNASLFIDGIYVGGDISAYGLDNVQRVEVLRGPQAAAFGRSTFAGAINYITHRPGSVAGGKLTLGFGNHGQKKGGLYYSGGSSDGSFGYEVGFNHRSTDSLYYNEASGKKDLGGTETQGFMGAIAWSPTEKLDLVLRVARQETDDDHVALGLIGTDNNNCYLPVPTATLDDPANYMVSRTKGYYCGDLPLPDAWRINTPGFDAIGRKAGLESESTRYSLKVDYNFDNNWLLTSSTGYNEQERYSGFDQSYEGVHNYVLSNGFAIPGALGTFTYVRSKDVSQGLRLSSDQGRDIAGLIGLNYYKFEGLPGWSGNLASPVATPNDPGNTTKNTAVYGQIRWNINDRWTTSLEARYAEDDLTLNGTSTASLAGPGGGIYTNKYTARASYSSFTPRWTLSYQATDNINLFGLFSKGNKPGGFNTFVYYAGLTDDARAELISNGFDKVQEEEVKNYEFGIKSDWLDNTLRINANIYQMDWSNQGLSLAASAMQWNGVPYNTTYTVNVGETRIRGFELESHWAFADGWLASLVYAYTDSEIQKFVNQDQADLLSDISNPNPNMSDPLADLAGKKSPLVPRNKATISLVRSGEFNNGWGYSANWDTTYQGARYLQVHNLARLGASTLSNFRFSVSPNNAWRFTAYVNNVFDDDEAAGGIRYLSFSAPYINVPLVSPNVGRQFVQQRDFGVTAPMPRMYGLEVSYRF